MAKHYTSPLIMNLLSYCYYFRDGRQLFDYLEMNHGIKPEMLDTLYKYAKFQYECGNYSGAAEYLYFYRVLVPGHQGRASGHAASN